MNDAKVVALIYRVEYERTKRFDKVKPLRYCQSPEFDLTVEDNIARFEFKKFYATEAEAIAAVKPFIHQWEFEAEMEGEPGCFKLMYEKAEIIDRNPLSPELRPEPLQASATAEFTVDFSVVAPARLWTPQYPSPPASGSFDADDPYVDKMRGRYNQYRQGQAKLPDVAYCCVDALKEKYGGIPAAAKACGISRSVLEEIGKLSSYKGGEDSRKAEGFGNEFTNEERRFLRAALKEVIIRAARVAADDSQRFPKITKEDLPKL